MTRHAPTSQRGRSLLFYFLITTGPLLLAIVLAATAYLAYERYGELESQRKAYEEQFARFYKDALEDSIWDYRLADLNTLCQGILAFPNVRGVRVMSNDTAIISVGEFPIDSDLRSVALDVPGYQTVAAWRLDTAVTAVRFSSVMSGLLMRHSVFLVITLLITGLATHLSLRRYVLEPTLRLREMLVRGAHGESQLAEVAHEGTGEIGTLIAGYNELVSRLNRDAEIQRQIDAQTLGHFERLRDFSRFAIENSDSYRELAHQLLGMLRNEPGCRDAGIAFCDSRGTAYVAALHGEMTGTWSTLVDRTRLLRYVDGLAGSDGDVSIASGRGQFFQKIVHRDDVYGVMVVDTDHASCAVREATRLFLYTVSRLAMLAFETSFRIEAERDFHRTRDLMLSAIGALTGVVIFDASGSVVASNEKAPRLLVDSDVPWADVDDFKRAVRASGARNADEFLAGFDEGRLGEEIDLELPDGSWRSFTGARLAEGARLLFIRDTTAHKTMQRTLERDRRMREVGMLGTGLTHDFNNYLQPIIGNVEYAIELLPADSEAATALKVALRQGTLVKDMTRQILDFLRDAKPVAEPVDPVATIAGALQLLKSRSAAVFSHRFEVTTSQWLLIDRIQFQRVVQNLVSNSVHQGRDRDIALTIRITDERTRGRDFVVVQFLDNCGGFSPEALQRGLDPFFTTKPHGQGTGVGLAMVSDFAVVAGGRVEIENVADGASVTLVLPAAPPALTPPAVIATPAASAGPVATSVPSAPVDQARDGSVASVPPEPNCLRPRPRVLVIEDSAAIGRLIEAAIAPTRSEVHSFRSAAEVEAALLTLDHRCDLVVSDLSLPDGQGPDVVAAIEAWAARKVPCIFISGDLSALNVLSLPSHHKFLEKPFAVADMRRLVTMIVGEPGSPGRGAPPPRGADDDAPSPLATK